MISAAAAIMVAVFLGFATEVDVVVKKLGVGMAVAIVLDATVVRMVLVPATMSLLGRWNWWMPAWLDRLLPDVARRGHRRRPDEPDPARTPAGVRRSPPTTTSDREETPPMTTAHPPDLARRSSGCPARPPPRRARWT